MRDPRWIEAALVLALVALLAVTVQRSSATLGPAIDEAAHIGAAYDLVASGRNRLNPEHPPLVKLAAGWSMRWYQGERFGDRLPIGVATAQWGMGRAVLFPQDRLDRGILGAARLPVLLLALAGALGVWGWSRALFGRWPALAALALYVGSPAIEGAATFVLTDLALGAFALLCLWVSWEAARRRSAPLALAAGVLAGLACMAKYSGPLVVAASAALMVLAAPVHAGHDGREGRIDAMRRLLPHACGLIAVLLIVGGWTVLSDYVDGMTWLYHNIRADYPAYAFGKVSLTGFWYYFPLAFLLKSSYPELLVLLGVGAAVLWRAPRRGEHADTTKAPPDWRTLAWLGLFPACYLLALILGGKNFGHRYLVPVYPFLFVAAGLIWARWRQHWARAVLLALAVLQLAAGQRAQPDPLSYFNGLLGCSGPFAAFCLDDSNVDWGQNLPRVAAIVAPRLERGGRLVVGTQTDEFFPLEVYFPDGTKLLPSDWRQPRAGYYAVSTQVLLRYAIQDPGVQRSPLFAALLQGESLGNSYLFADLRGATERN